MPVCILPLKQFVGFNSLDPEEDPLSGWLEDLGLLNQETSQRISEADMHLPLDLEYSFREKLERSLDADCLTLLFKLLNNKDGIELKLLCLSAGTWKDPETCTGRLHHFKLVKAERGILLPLTIARDPRVQYLIGARASPCA